MRTFTREEIRRLIEDWRKEECPADAAGYADTMADILEALLNNVSSNFVIQTK